jgi:hypothetical protein
MIEYSTAFYITLGFSLFTGVFGYYVGERGWQGVQNDLNNVKLDVATIKGKIDGPATVVTTPATTVATSIV